jgi:hypothetical protein
MNDSSITFTSINTDSVVFYVRYFKIRGEITSEILRTLTFGNLSNKLNAPLYARKLLFLP